MTATGLAFKGNGVDYEAPIRPHDLDHADH